MRYKKGFLAINIALMVVASIFALDTFSSKAHNFIKNAVAAVGNVTGISSEGTLNFLPRWVGASGSNQIGDSLIYDSGTNVGIGTSGPTEKFQVLGNIDVNGAGNSFKGSSWKSNAVSTGLGLFGSTDTGFYTASGGTLQFVNPVSGSAANTVTFQSGGLVGIGATPVDQLTVNNTIRAKAGYVLGTWDTYPVRLGAVADNAGVLNAGLYNGTSTQSMIFATDQYAKVVNRAGSGYMPLYVSDVYSSTGNVWLSQVCRSTGTNCPSLSQWTTSGSNIYYNTGNVGIGTATPGSLLTLNTAGAATQLDLSRAGVSQGSLGVDTSGLYFTSGAATQALRFYRNNGTTETMRIDPSGNVGIGTTTPRDKLEVNGKILNTAAVNGNANLGQYDLGVGTVGANTIYGYTASCVGNNSGDCSQNGGVVLGPVNTNAAVNITTGGVIRANGAITSGGQNVCLQNGTNCPASSGIGGSGASPYIPKFTASNSVGNSAIQDDGTNIKIGLGGSPGVPRGLQVLKGGILTGSLEVDDSQGGTGAGNLTVDSKISIGAVDPVIKLAVGDTDTGLDWVSDGVLTIKTNSGERMRFDASGNVGIGGTPGYKFDVQGASGIRIGAGTYDSNLVFGNNGTWKSGIRVYDNGEAEMRIWTQQATGEIVLTNGYSGDGATTLPSDGLWVKNNNVGIGNYSVTAPSYKLNVSGDVNITGTYRVNGTAILSGSGSNTYLPVFTGAGTIANSAIYRDASGYYVVQSNGWYVPNAWVIANDLRSRSGYIYAGSNDWLAIQATDSWLRLNQSSQFSSGVYTPGVFRSDGGIQIHGSGGLLLVPGGVPSNVQNGMMWME